MSDISSIKYYDAQTLEELTIEQGVFEPSDSDPMTPYQFGQYNHKDTRCQSCMYKKLCEAFAILGLGQQELTAAGRVINLSELEADEIGHKYPLIDIVERKTLIDAKWSGTDLKWEVTSPEGSVAYNLVKSWITEVGSKPDYLWTYSLDTGDGFEYISENSEDSPDYYQAYTFTVSEESDKFYITVIGDGSQYHEYLKGGMIPGDNPRPQRIKFSLAQRDFK